MIATAFPVGFFAGLFGIGGGLITVPFLFFIFEALGVDKNFLMHLAVGTSFAIIIPTSIVSVLTHKKHNSVDVRVIKNYGFFAVSYTHLRAHETGRNLVCRLLLEKKKN